MRLAFAATALVLGAGTCCCGDLVSALFDEAGVDGPPAILGASVPDELAGIPTYPGADYFAGTSLGGTTTANWHVQGVEPFEVIDYYQARLEEDGWEVRSTVHLDELSTLEADRGDEDLTVSAMLDEDQVLVSVGLDAGK